MRVWILICLLALKVVKKFGDCETAISAGIGVGAVFAGPWGAVGLGTVTNMFFCATPVS